MIGSVPMHLRALSTCLLLAIAACAEGPSTDQCAKLLDHLVELQVKESGGTPLTDDQKAQVERYAQKVKYMGTCEEKTTKKLVECALAATTTEEARACDEGKKAKGSGS